MASRSVVVASASVVVASGSVGVASRSVVVASRSVVEPVPGIRRKQNHPRLLLWGFLNLALALPLAATLNELRVRHRHPMPVAVPVAAPAVYAACDWVRHSSRKHARVQTRDLHSRRAPHTRPHTHQHKDLL